MDTSKEYIKMCDKSGLDETCSFVIPPFQNEVKYIGNDVYVELDRGSSAWRTVRLLRQSQIQEMMPVNNCKCSCCLIFHLNQFIEDNIEGFFDTGIETIEQYWLAFYMFEEHQKTWNGEKWIK